ncbi:MAG TPA: hypothetical protein VG122_16940 [Gemmata sp.]|nr:hypothetical protein [Gemmata sp.]
MKTLPLWMGITPDWFITIAIGPPEAGEKMRDDPSRKAHERSYTNRLECSRDSSY